MGCYSTISALELVRACAEQNDGAAWEEFIARFLRPISLSILRTAYGWGKYPREVIDDLVQETYLKLCINKCRLLLDFATSHPEAITGYVKTIAVNVARDHFKSLQTQRRGSGQAAQVPENFEARALGGSLGGEVAIEREILLKQIDKCLEACSLGSDKERDRLIFWLYYQQGMSARSIAALPTVDLTAKGVESAIFRLTRLVREQLVNVRFEQPSVSPLQGEKGSRTAESYS